MNIKKTINNIILHLLYPFTYLSLKWIKFLKQYGPGQINEDLFMKLGVYPILDHYYSPLINPKKHLKKSLREDRNLPGINFNVEEQLELLDKFIYNEEILKFPLEKKNDNDFYFDNIMYSSGDAEYLYNMIRHFKPKRIIEIGSGQSTLMALNAIKKNKEEVTHYQCRHVCIEPYECDWLKDLDVELIRQKVEDIDMSLFRSLEENDILFIDSSHMIRPQGDVLFEFLEVLPILNSGVLVHIHDIFSPKDYLDEWIFAHKFWNEQYLLEAFLSHNKDFRILAALNYLLHNHKEKFSEKCPIYKANKGNEINKDEPRAFWIVKN